MYEHPIKRAGLSMNRILYSNTRMVRQGFPVAKGDETKFNVMFKFRTYENGKVSGTTCKYTYRLLLVVINQLNYYTCIRNIIHHNN